MILPGTLFPRRLNEICLNHMLRKNTFISRVLRKNTFISVGATFWGPANLGQVVSNYSQLW